MTATGAIVGTIEYMAPEQARAGTVDHRADIYAFGLILNDMLVGRRQTAGVTPVAELMSRMQQVPPTVRSIDPSIPPAVDALITKCVQPDPDARFQSMAEVLAELDRMGPDGHSVAWHVELRSTSRCRLRANRLALRFPHRDGRSSRSGLPRAQCVARARRREPSGAADSYQAGPATTAPGGVDDFTGDSAVPKRVRRSDAGLAGVESGSGARHRARPVAARPHRFLRSGSGRSSRISALRRTPRWRPPNLSAWLISRTPAASCGGNTLDSATRFESTRRCRISIETRACR